MDLSANSSVRLRSEGSTVTPAQLPIGSPVREIGCLSVRKALILATLIFLLSVVGCALGFYLVSEDTLAHAGLRIGAGEIAAAYEYTTLQMSVMEQRVTQIADEIRLSDFDPTTRTSVMEFFNTSLYHNWVTATVHERWSLGFGLLVFFPDGTMQYPQIYFDLLDGRRREWVQSHTFADGLNWYFTFQYTAGTATQPPEITIGAPAYSPAALNATWYKELSDRDGVLWQPAQQWVSRDGNLYHFFTYATTFHYKGIQMSPIGWMPASEFLTGLVLENTTEAVMFIADSRGRIITTTKEDLNDALEDALRAQQASEGTRIDDTTDAQLGINFPNASVRNVYRAIKSEIVFGGPTPVLVERRVRVDGAWYFVVVREVHNSGELQLVAVWFQTVNSVVGEMREKQLLIAMLMVAVVILVSLLTIMFAYSALIEPLAHLSLLLCALASLDMQQVQALRHDRGDEDYSIAEVQALFKAYDSVQRTTMECLPYLPGTDGVGEGVELESLDLDGFDLSDNPSDAQMNNSVGFNSSNSSHRGLRGVVPSVRSPTQVNNSPLQRSDSPSLASSTHNHHNRELLSVRAQIAQGELSHADIVVAHFSLHPDLYYHTVDRSTWKDAVHVLQYTVSKAARDYKAAVFQLATSSVSLVWHRVVQPESKACEAAFDVLTNFFEKMTAIYPQHNPVRDQPLLSVGIAHGVGLVGVTGTILKKTFTCEGEAVTAAEVYACVGRQICCPVVVASRIEDHAKMFAEFRPVEIVELPAHNSVLGVRHHPTLRTLYQCVSIRLAHAEGDNEWMYVLEHQEAKDNEAQPAALAFNALVRGDLVLARTMFSTCRNQDATDPYFQRRCRTLGVPLQSLQVPQSTSGETLLDVEGDEESKTIEVAASSLSPVETYFAEVREGRRSYCRPVVYQCSLLLSFEA